MYENERWQMILHLLDEHKFLTVHELTKHIDASPATLRRDIVKLNNLNLIHKIHGGIKLKTDTSIEEEMIQPDPDNAPILSNDRIVKTAVNEIEDNDCIYISCSAYTFPIIRSITQKDVTIITDLLPNINSFSNKNINFYFLEGDIDSEKRCILFSDESIKKIELLNFNKIFLECDAIDKEIGFSTSNAFDFKMKSILCKKYAKPYVIAKKDAFDKHKFMSFANISDLTIISDEIPESYKKVCTFLPK